MDENRKLEKAVIMISGILFLSSLTQKSYCTTSQCGDSVMVFLLGWFAMLTGGAGISWIANPLLFASWAMLKRNNKISVFLSLLATLFAISFLLFDSILANEAGDYQQVISYKSGYWLWVCSCMSMLVGVSILFIKNKDARVS
ncbi:MAG: hypothetical protein ABIN80_19045 [Dyadobacter sp.]|uniref:hypothetical protein n=1 Tax=Dyadobacter sp. TaxID=1914288 RepID=UPI003265D0F8